MTDLRVCEQLQVVRQLVGQACGAKGAGARSLNLPVNSKWKERNICTDLALTAPYTCHLHLQKSGLRSRQRFQALQDLSPIKDCMMKCFADYPHRLMDVVPVLDDILSYSWFVLRQVWQGTFPQELESGPVLSTKHLLNLRNCRQLNSFEETHHGVQVVRV